MGSEATCRADVSILEKTHHFFSFTQVLLGVIDAWRYFLKAFNISSSKEMGSDLGSGNLLVQLDERDKWRRSNCFGKKLYNPH